jgi:hypothetical protein
VRYGLRTLRRAKGFSLLALAILGIGVGAGTTMFSALNGVLLRLPYADPDSTTTDGYTTSGSRPVRETQGSQGARTASARGG